MYTKGRISGPNDCGIWTGYINCNSNGGRTYAWTSKIEVNEDSKELLLSVMTRIIDELNGTEVEPPSYAKAFNSWMDDFVNNPSEYESSQDSAVKHLKEKLNGEEPSYGQVCEQVFKQYLGEE